MKRNELCKLASESLSKTRFGTTQLARLENVDFSAVVGQRNEQGMSNPFCRLSLLQRLQNGEVALWRYVFNATNLHKTQCNNLHRNLHDRFLDKKSVMMQAGHAFQHNVRNGDPLELYAPPCWKLHLILHCDVSKRMAEGELQNMSPIRGLLRFKNLRPMERKMVSLKLFMEQKCFLDREKIAKWLLFLLEVS